ncbi:MAG TPA: APC family permease [Pyrinomonadaceae bacterium]|nr:APC family permease [Pyrinomonadaceae bacterium]
MKDIAQSGEVITNQQSRGTLLRVLGVGFGLAVTIGGTIGMGILRTPGEVAARLPTPKLFIGVWILGGVYALLGTISVAELGAMIPRSGGWYVFVHRAMGNYPGFVVGWSDWLSTCGTLAVIAMVVGEYTAVLAPRLAGRDKPVALAVVLLFAALQWRGIRWGSFTQNLTSLLKTMIFAVIAIAAFTFAGKSAAGTPLLVPHRFALFTALIIALQGVLYTYDGWYGVIYFGEEVRDPKRDVVRSMFGGVLLVIAIYLVVNLAYVYVLPMSQLAGENFAAGAVARAIFGVYGDKTIRVLAILSLLSTINAYTLTAPRILYAMSCDELFHRHATRVNRGGTPTVTLLLSTIAAMLFIVSGTFNAVLAALAFFFVANYAMAYASVIVLRRREPNLPRPYRTWGYPWTTLIVLLGSITFLVGAVISDKKHSLWALMILAASYPLYLIVKRLAPPQAS